MKIFIKDNISHYFLRRDLLPEQSWRSNRAGHAALPGGAREPILPLLFYWLPHIQILEPNWLKEKLIRTLENYLAVERNPNNQVISIT